MKMKMKMKIRARTCGTNKPRSSHGRKHGTCKKCLSIMMLVCINPLSASAALIIKTSQLICCANCYANQLTGFYMRATLRLNSSKS